MNFKVIAVIVIIVALAIVGFVMYDRQPSFTGPIYVAGDPLCSYVSKSQLRCVVILGSDSLLGPGAMVDYPADATPQTPVPLPTAELFSSNCLVPGEQADALGASFKKQEQENSVSIPIQTYLLNRSFKVGLDLPIPRVYNLNIKAGPNVSQIQEVRFEAKRAWVKYIDENALLDLLANAGIKKSCIDRLIASKYSVISKALIAEDLGYEFTDKSGQSYSFSAAAKKGELQVDAGGSTSADVDQATKTLASTPVVLGVSFLNPTLLQQQKAKLSQPVVFSSSGNAEVVVASLGGQGSFGKVVDSKPIGSPAAVTIQGREASECEAGFDRTVSSADIRAHVLTPSPESLAFSGTGSIRGGHYATGNCVALFGVKKLVNLSGHDTGVSGQYSFTGLTRATVRSDDTSLLKVQFSGLPDNSRIEVHDPTGRALPARETEQSTSNVSGNGGLSYRIQGAGVYLVSLSSTVQQVVNGAGTVPMSTNGNLSVSVQ